MRNLNRPGTLLLWVYLGLNLLQTLIAVAFPRYSAYEQLCGDENPAVAKHAWSLRHRYCDSPSVWQDRFAHAAAAIAVTIAIVTLALHRLISHRNVVLREVAASLAAAIALSSYSFYFSSTRSRYSLLLVGPRPFVYVSACSLIREFGNETSRQ